MKAGWAQTVLGPVDAAELGVTLAHDHVLMDGSFMYVDPPLTADRYLADEQITLENRGWVAYHWTSSHHNVHLDSEDMAITELQRFVAAGGRTVVDPTNNGLGRDPEPLVRIARATGSHLIVGSGYYLGGTHPPGMDDRALESITDEIVADIQVGIAGTEVRAGLIGEIGCTYPWLPNEKKSLRAAVAAQVETGAPLMVHPGRDPMSPVEIVEIVEQEGGDLDRTIICHIDRTCTDRLWLSDMAATGVYLEYDLFGNESSWYPPNPKVDMPSDAERMEVVLWHFEKGLEDKVLLSHDIATKHRLHAYGGLGYDHLLTNVVPRLRQRGLSEGDVNRLLIDNPARVLGFTSTAGP
ncbi:MAG: aryldialkylphosphatase [Acidimicrobiaceae bacterium]|nr:aryldialkylphosphatase [Acidimicrobiaceae bacterium]|tara:strand:- start:873 stop:1931 length:1059 start_codon:yes stop_codon:yes gene_type:complete